MILAHQLLILRAWGQEDGLPPCAWDHPIHISELVNALQEGRCYLKTGVSITVPIEDGSGMMSREEPPLWRTPPAQTRSSTRHRQETPMEPDNEKDDAVDPHGEPTHPPKGGELHEQVAAPDPGVADLGQFTALAGENAGVAVILSLVAVVGGGAAWKFYSQHSAQKHELEMAKLEKGQNDHQACEAKRLELANRVDALEKKLTGAIDLDGPSPSDLDKKIKNLERRVREMKPKA